MKHFSEIGFPHNLVKTSIAALFVFFSHLSYSQVTVNFDDGFQAMITGFDDRVSTIVVDDQGRIILGGIISNVSGVERHNLARVSSSGELDAGFAPVFDGEVLKVELLENGSILALGEFSRVSGNASPGLAMLDQNGQLISEFAPDLGEGEQRVTKLAVQGNKLIVAAGVQPYNNFEDGSDAVNPQRIKRLMLDGSVDPGFNSNLEVGFVDSIEILSDNSLVLSDKIAIACCRDTSGTVLSLPTIRRYSIDGQLENDIGVNVNGTVSQLLDVGKDQFLAVGCFTRIGFNFTNCTRDGCSMEGGAFRASLARLNSDLSVDTTFNFDSRPGAGVNSLSNDCMTEVSPISKSGEYLMRSNTRLSRVSTGGTIGDRIIIPFFKQNVSSSFAFQPDGKILLGGRNRQLFPAPDQPLNAIFRAKLSDPELCMPIRDSGSSISFVCL